MMEGIGLERILSHISLENATPAIPSLLHRTPSPNLAETVHPFQDDLVAHSTHRQVFTGIYAPLRRHVFFY